MTFRFGFRFALYILPFALPFFVFTGALVYIGESLPLALVAQMQNGDQPVLYRPRYGNRDLAYKDLMTETRQPEVLVLGSSRVLQMRSLLLHRNSRAFYNAAAPAWQLAELNTFLQGLDSTALPRILIVGLDHPWFNSAYSDTRIEAEYNDFQQIFRINRSIMQAVIDGTPFDVGRLIGRVEPGHGGLALGIDAIMDGQGFRNDGSEQYGDFLVAHWLWPENERQRHIDLMRSGGDMYVWGDAVSAASLAEVETLLGFARAHNITVIGFLPPYMPTLYEEMRASGNFGYIDSLPPRLSDLFATYDAHFFDFSDGALLGANDGDFFDGWHGSELTFTRLYLRLLEALPDLLEPYSDPAHLADIIDNAGSTFDVFGNRF